MGYRQKTLTFTHKVNMAIWFAQLMLSVVFLLN